MNYLPLPVFLFFVFPYLLPFQTQISEFLISIKLMGVKCSLRSNTSKSNRPLLGGEENPSTKEKWIIPPFFEDYLFNKSFDWESIPCSANPLTQHVESLMIS